MARPNFGKLSAQIQQSKANNAATAAQALADKEAAKAGGSDVVATADPLASMARQTESFKKYNGAQGLNEGNLKASAFGKDYFKQKILGFDGGDVIDQSVIGGYGGGIDPFSSGEDYEHIRRQAQGKTAVGVNILGSFAAKTANNTVGAIVGGFYGLGKGVGRYAIDSIDPNVESSLIKSGADVFDNEFLRGSDKVTEAIDRNTSVFTSQKARDDGGLGMFGSIETLKDLSDGAAFIAGAIATEAIMNTFGNLLGGTGVTTAAGRWARLAANGSKMLLGKAASLDKFTGVGRYAMKVGEEARLISAFLSKTDEAASMSTIARAGMKEGLSLDAIKNHYRMVNTFEKAALGTRKALSGSIYESSMEARQAKKIMMDASRASVAAEAKAKGLKGEDADAYIASRMQQEEHEANKLGLGVLTANIALLSASNYYQFPTVFGKNSYDALKRVDGNAGKFLRESIGGQAVAVEQKGLKNIINKTTRLLAGPGSEFIEETGQGVIQKSFETYHERRANGRSSAKGMESSVSNFLTDISDSFGGAMTNQFGTKEGIYEGIIGAILGAVGIPGVKRHPDGKYRGMTIHGGIWEGMKGKSAEERASLQNAMDTLDFGKTVEVLKDNTRRSNEAARRTEDENDDFDNNDFTRKNNYRDDKVFAKVKEYYDKGLQSYLVEEMQALDDMSLEDYGKTIGDESVTVEEKEAQMKDINEKMKNYGDAYSTVYEKMKMKDIADSPANRQLLDHLVYAVGTDAESLRQIRNITAKLAEKGMMMSNDKITRLASLHANFGTLSNEEISRELDDIHNNTLREGIHEDMQSRGKVNETLDSSGRRLTRRNKEILRLLDKATSKEEFDKQNSFIESQSAEVAASLKNSPVYKRASELFSEENLSRHKEKSNALAEKRKTEIEDENSQVERKNKKNNIALADKYQTKDSEIMQALIDKHKVLTAGDLTEYIELMKEYRESETRANEASGSFLDKMANEESLDYNNAINELAELARRRDTSLRVAASLYGFDNLRYSSFKVFHAEMVANLRNIEDYSDRLKFLVYSREDVKDEGIELAMLVENIKLATGALEEDKETLEKLLMNNPGEALKANLELLMNHADESIKIAKELVELHEDIEEVEEIKKATNAKEEEITPDEKIEGAKIKIQAKLDEEDLGEYEKAQELVKETLTTMQLKESFIVYAAEVNGPNGKALSTINKAVKEGLIEKNDVVYLKPDLTTTKPGNEAIDFQNYLNKEAFEGRTYYDFYVEGEKKFNANKNVINTPRVDFELKKDGTFDFTDDDADLQIFISAFRVKMNFTNDKSIPANDKTGSKRRIDKNESKGLEEELFLFSPFFLLNQENAKKLVNDIRLLKVEADDLDREIANQAEGQSKNSNQKYLELIRRKILGKENQLNDKAIYNTRKRILIEMMFNDVMGIDNKDYAFESYASVISVGSFNEHTVPGEFSNFPVSSNSPTEENALFSEIDKELKGSDGEIMSANEQLIRSNKFGYVNADGFIVNPITKQVIAGVAGKKSTGHLYYIHTTIAGNKVPVHINRNKIGSNEVILNDLMKYIQESVASKGGMDNLLAIKNTPIELKKGDFSGMFDDKIDSGEKSVPKNLIQLMNVFLMTNSGSNTDEIGSTVFGIKKEFDANVVQDKGDKLITDVDTEVSVEQSQSENNQENKKTVGNASFKFLDNDTQGERLEKIKTVIANSFFMLKVNSFVANGKIDTKAIDVIMESGLITHGFSINENYDKVFDKNAPAAITISPMNSEVVQDSMNFRKRKLVKSSRDLLKEMRNVIGYKGTYKDHKGDIVHVTYGTKEIVNLFLNKASTKYKQSLKTAKELKGELPSEVERSEMLRVVFKEITDKTNSGIIELLTSDNAKNEAIAILKSIDLLQKSKVSSLKLIKENAASLISNVKELSDKRADANNNGTVAGIRYEEFVMLFTIIQTASTSLMINSPAMFDKLSTGFNAAIGTYDIVDELYPSDKSEEEYHALSGIKRNNEKGVALTTPDQANEKYVKSLIDAISVFSELDAKVRNLGSSTLKQKSLPIRLTINEILSSDATNHTKVSILKHHKNKEISITEYRKDGSMMDDIRIETVDKSKGFTFFISEKAAEGNGMINKKISLEEAKTKFEYDESGNLVNGMVFINRFRTNKAGKMITTFPAPMMWGSKNNSTVLINKAGNMPDTKHTVSYVGSFDFPGFTNKDGALTKDSLFVNNVGISIEKEGSSKNYEIADFMDVRKEVTNISTLRDSMDGYEEYLKEENDNWNQAERNDGATKTVAVDKKVRPKFGDMQEEEDAALAIENKVITMTGIGGKEYTGTEAENIAQMQLDYTASLDKGKKKEKEVLLKEVKSKKKKEFLDLVRVGEGDLSETDEAKSKAKEITSAMGVSVGDKFDSIHQEGVFIEVLSIQEGVVPGELEVTYLESVSKKNTVMLSWFNKEVLGTYYDRPENIEARRLEDLGKKEKAKETRAKEVKSDLLIDEAYSMSEVFLNEEITKESAEMLAMSFDDVISQKGKDAAFIAISQKIINNSKAAKRKVSEAEYEYIYAALFQETPTKDKIDKLKNKCTI